MKQLLYLVMSLVVIAAIIPSASASYPCNLAPVTGTYTGNAPWNFYTGGNMYDNVNTMCTACGFGTGTSVTVNSFGSNGQVIEYHTSWVNMTFTNNGSFMMQRYLTCSNGNKVRMSDGNCVQNAIWDNYYRLPYGECTAGTMPDSPINFTGSPLIGSSPLNVLFTSVNLTNTTGSSWSFGDGNITSPATSPIWHLYQNQGYYTVRLDYFNNSGVAGYIQKNNYINVSAPNATSTTYAVARDLYTGFAINGAQVDMYDVENSSWKNTTTTNGEGSITTLLGHTINIYGSATGYSDDNLIGVPEVDGGYYSLLLTPTNLTTYNTTPGNLTLVVTVQDLQIPHQTLQGAEVTAAWGSQYASGTTNAAGNTFFTVPNNTAIHLSAFKSGYASGSSTHITGTANGGSTMETAIVYIGTDYVTPIPTVTWTGTGTIPPTVDPYPCIGDGSAQDTANCQRKQGSMAADLISYGPDLVKFFIMLTFIGGLLLITKR